MQQASMQLTLALALSHMAGASLLRNGNADVPKAEPVIANPVDGDSSVGDMVPDAPPPKPIGQEYNHQFAPVSVPAAPDISPTDPSEYLAGWRGAVANALDPMSAEDGKKFDGSTCKSVCSACTIFAEQQSGLCSCYATCTMGECGKGSGVMPHIGWSNNAVTTPKTQWHAKCNRGKKNCVAECMDDSFKKEIQTCKNSKGSPIECFKKLSLRNLPQPLDAREQVHYCTRKGMKTCDTFRTVPNAGGWACFQWADKCKEKAMVGFKIPKASAMPSGPSVWENVGR